jgi:dTDP-4-amino-4,6-dideoxygalactose transaminase
MPLLEEIWETGVLSNNGPMHERLEQEVAEFLRLPYVSLFCNATTALITAQQALGLNGEIITTPYSFAATSHALLWMQNTPVFVDINPGSMCIDATQIERAITDQTVGIMPLHCYGNMCDTQAIKAIATKHGLKVIYDACHSFGIEDERGSVLRHGDISVVSFHATKVFNTFEGGLLVSSNEATKKKVDRLKNFGFVDEITVTDAGLNGKMSEFNAAVGLVQMRHLPSAISKRKACDTLYRDLLAEIAGVVCVEPVGQTMRNYSYFPVLIDTSCRLSRDDLYELLKSEGVYGRRYFYPLISDFPMYKGYPSANAKNLPVARDISSRVICLPLYPDLPSAEVERICSVISAGLS